MGQPKQLLAFRRKPILQHVLDAAADAGLDEIIVVLGHQAKEIRAAVPLPPGARTVLNPDHASGQASSLRAGLLAAGDESRAALVLLGDELGVGPDRMRAVLTAWERAGTPAARAEYAGSPGHPVVLGRAVWEALASLRGDEGARAAFLAHPEWVTAVPLPGPAPVEVDTPDDYRRLMEGSAGGSVEGH